MKTNNKARAKHQKTTGSKGGGGTKASGKVLKSAHQTPVEARYESNDALEDMMAALELLSSTHAS